MPELTHDAEDGFHEIQLSGKQLVFLFMATTVVSVVIFLCGVLVGRGVRAERGSEDPSIAAAQTAPVSLPVQPDAAPAPTESPVPAAEEKLSYADRLQGGQPPAENLKQTPEPVSPPQPSAAPTATPTRAGADVPSSARSGNWVIQVHALQNRDAANTFVRSLVAKGYPAFLLAPSPGSPQIFRVQIGAYRDRDEAEKVATRLEKEEQFKPAIKRR